jgi:hypothetical protein
MYWAINGANRYFLKNFYWAINGANLTKGIKLIGRTINFYLVGRQTVLMVIPLGD